MLMSARAVLLAGLVSSLATAAAALASPRQNVQGAAEAVEQALTEGQHLLEKSLFADALPIFEDAVVRAERLADEGLLARSLRGLGSALWRLGKYDDLVSAMGRALPLYQKLGDASNEAKCHSDIGLGLYSLGRYDEALTHYERSLEANQRAPVPSVEGTTLANIGLVHWRQGRLDEAVRFFERSLAIRRTVGQPGQIGQSLNHLGMASRARSEYQRALEYYTEAVELRRKASDRQGEAQTLNNIGAVYADLGMPERAIDMYRQALTIAEQIGYTTQIALSNENIGANLLTLNRTHEALSRHEAAVAIYRRIDRRGMLAPALNRMGEIRLRLDDPAAARQAVIEAIDIARAVGDREIESRALLNLGDIALRVDDPRIALQHVDEALAIARQIRIPGVEYRALADRGRALRLLDRDAEAIDAFQASARLVNDLRAQIGSDFAKVGFMDARQAVFTDLVAALWDGGRRDQALEAAEAGRARAFADLLMQRQVVGRRGEQGNALEALRVAVDGMQRAPSPAAVSSRSGGGDTDLMRKRAEADVDRALDTLRAVDAELASLVAVESPSVSEIRSLAIERRVTFVEYLAAEQRLFVWVIAPDGTVRATTVAVPRERIDVLVADLRRAIDSADLDALRHPERIAATTNDLERFLIEPIRAWLPTSPADAVVLIPSGSLALLPFAALTDGAGRPLAERHTLALAPSISVFRYTPTKRVGGGIESGGALIVADPRPPEGSGVVSLPGTRQEADRIVSHLRQAKVLLLSGDEASEAAVKRNAGARSLLHFATHGLISAERPLASSLLLSDGDGEDGYLRVDEVLSLDLHADLVVLSGCSTGLGRLTGDGIFGLSRAFIYAGTPSVVVSQWDVSDRATAVLMGHFYAQLAAGRSKAAALRAAQLETRRRYRHPALWAGFVLVGEPR